MSVLSTLDNANIRAGFVRRTPQPDLKKEVNGLRKDVTELQKQINQLKRALKKLEEQVEAHRRQGH